MSDGGPLVCVPVYGQFPIALDCLRSVAAFTPEDVEVLVIDDCSPSRFLDHVPPELARDPRFHFQRNEVNLGYLRSANLALRWRPGSDVALVNSDVLVSTGWFERLRDAAYSADHVATASALTNEGSILTVELDRSRPAVRGAADLLDLNERLGEFPRLVAPEIPVAVGHCFYIRAEAITAVGVFDEAFGAGYEEEVDFSLRCKAVGLRHVVAPDVYVIHQGGASFGSRAAALRKRGHRLILDRYPTYARAVSQYLDRADNLRALFLRVLLADRRKLRLLIDGRAPESHPGGTANGSIELARVLSGLPDLTVALVTDAPDFARGDLPDSVRVIPLADLRGHLSRDGRFDCVFRGSPPPSTSELASLWRWAHRVLVVQSDFGAYEDPDEHANADRFFDYRDAVVLSALTADATLGLSRFALAQAAPLGVPIDPTAGVLGIGAPSVAARSRGRPPRHLVLVAGASSRHDNTLYALRLLERLSAGGVDLDIALVGPDPAFGSSRADEDRFAQEHPDLARGIERHDGRAGDAMDELWDRTSVALYPSLGDGFGSPFEAAARGVPSLFGRRGGMTDVYPEIPLSLGFRSLDADADALRRLLEDEPARSRQLDYMRERAAQANWQEVAERLVARLWEVCTSPPRIPSDIRRRLHSARRLRGGLLLRLRRSPIGHILLPAGSSRAAAVKSLLPTRLWRD